MEDCASERLHQALEEELHIREEEGEAEHELAQLKWNEEILKETLDELKAIKKEQERNQQERQGPSFTVFIATCTDAITGMSIAGLKSCLSHGPIPMMNCSSWMHVNRPELLESY